jgi:carbon-monoxide dehydrogenase medium subunit
MKPAPFTYHAPRTVDEAVALLARYADDGGRIIAGGQSLVPMMAFRLAAPPHLIDINSVTDLDRLSVQKGDLEIGALVRHATLETMTTGGALGRLLSTVSPAIAHAPIRNRGTFCGSIVQADPSSEWCLVAATLSAEIAIQSSRGSRTVPAAEFFLGIMTTDLAPDELVVGCRLPLLREDTRFGFDEVSRRAGDFAMAAVLVTYRVENGRIVDCRIGIGGVEPVPRRLKEVETELTGAAPEADSFRRAAETAAAVVNPMADDKSGPAFRRRLTRAVVERALKQCL